MRLLWTAFIAGGVVSGVLVACSSSSATAQHSTQCTTATFDEQHTNVPTRTPSRTDLPECTPRCGATLLMDPTLGPEYALADLPTGACQFDGDACQFVAGYTQQCGSTVQLCNRSGLECDCESGTWHCYYTTEGAGACAGCGIGVDGGATP